MHAVGRTRNQRVPIVQVLAFGHQSIGAGDWEPAQIANHIRRQSHAIGNFPVTPRIVDAFTRLAVEQLAANVGEMNLARVLVLELDEAAATAAVAQAFPFDETHLVERLRAPEWLGLLVFRRQTLCPLGAGSFRWNRHREKRSGVSIQSRRAPCGPWIASSLRSSQ